LKKRSRFWGELRGKSFELMHFEEGGGLGAVFFACAAGGLDGAALVAVTASFY
jgi:hypothetical protein